MKLSVFGLGYVGTVSAGCFANDGHEVIGVDPIRTKINLINRGKSPIVEADIGEIVSATVSRGNLRGTDDSVEAVLSDLRCDPDRCILHTVGREVPVAPRSVVG